MIAPSFSIIDLGRCARCVRFCLRVACDELDFLAEDAVPFKAFDENVFSMPPSPSPPFRCSTASSWYARSSSSTLVRVGACLRHVEAQIVTVLARWGR